MLQHAGTSGAADSPPRRSRTLEQAETPVYLRIRAELHRRIEAAEYPPLAALPSQRQLSEEFGVTVMTLRQALELLKRDRLIATRPGLGTFVLPKRFTYPTGPLRSLTQEMAEQGLSVATSVLSMVRERADDATARALALMPGRTAIRIERLRAIDGVLSVFQRSMLPSDLWGAFDAPSLERASLYELLTDRLGLEVQRATERLYPTLLDARTARLLGRREGEAALLSERLTLATGDRPVLHDRAIIPGDRLVIAADRCRDDVTIRYELRGVEGSPLASRRLVAQGGRE